MRGCLPDQRSTPGPLPVKTQSRALVAGEAMLQRLGL